jgi:hypothetical protein
LSSGLAFEENPDDNVPMPRQPLHNITDEKPLIEIGPRTFSKRPKLAAYVAQVIAGWAQVELALACVLARYTSRNIEQSIDMYLSIDGFRAQARLVEAAAKTVLTKDDLRLFDATLRFIRRNYNIRNEMAHWTWGISEALPDALLIIEPRANKKLYALQFNLVDQDLSKIIPRIQELTREQERSIFVYRENDLVKCAEDMFQAEILSDRLQQLCSAEKDKTEGRAVLLSRAEIRGFYEKET